MPVEKITTPPFRVSFPHVFEPHSGFENQEPKYSLTMLFPKDSNLAPLKKLAKEAAIKKWGDKIPSNLRNPFRDGTAEKPELEGYEGMIFVAASSKMKPGIVDQSVNPILDQSDFYAGCWARATITAFAYDTMGNKGVAFGLQNIQKLKDDEAFSGRAKAEDEFDPVEGYEPAEDGQTAEEDIFG